MMLQLQLGFCLPLLIHQLQGRNPTGTPSAVCPHISLSDGEAVPSRTVLLWGTLWLLSPWGCPLLGLVLPWQRHPKSLWSCAGAQPSIPICICSSQGDAQDSPSAGCTPERDSLLPNQLYTDCTKLRRGTSRSAHGIWCFSGEASSLEMSCLPALQGHKAPGCTGTALPVSPPLLARAGLPASSCCPH